MSHTVFIILQILPILYNFTVHTKSSFSFDYHSKKDRAGNLLESVKLRLRKLQRPQSWEQNLGWESSVLFGPRDLFWNVRGLRAAFASAESCSVRLLPQGKGWGFITDCGGGVCL